MSAGVGGKQNQGGHDSIKGALVSELEENGARFRASFSEHTDSANNESLQNIRHNPNAILHEILEPVLTINSERNNFPSKESLSGIKMGGLSPLGSSKEELHISATPFSPLDPLASLQLDSQVELFLSDEVVFRKNPAVAVAPSNASVDLATAKESLEKSLFAKLSSGSGSSGSASTGFERSASGYGSYIPSGAAASQPFGKPSPFASSANFDFGSAPSQQLPQMLGGSFQQLPTFGAGASMPFYPSYTTSSYLGAPQPSSSMSFQSSSSTLNKLRMMQLPRQAFESFFQFLSVHRKPLLREIVEYPLIKQTTRSSPSELAMISPLKSEAKPPEKLKERPSSKHNFEKDKKDKKDKVTVQSVTNVPIEYSRLPSHKNAEYSSIFLAQCVINFEINSLLLAVSYLLRVTVTDQRRKEVSPAIHSSNIVAFLFESCPVGTLDDWKNPLAPYLLASKSPAKSEAKLTIAEMLQHLPNFNDSIDIVEATGNDEHLTEEQELELAQKMSLQETDAEGDLPVIAKDGTEKLDKLRQDDGSIVHPFCSMALFKSEYFPNVFRPQVIYSEGTGGNNENSSVDMKSLTPKQIIASLLTIVSLNCDKIKCTNPLQYLKPSSLSTLSAYAADNSKPCYTANPPSFKLETSPLSFMLIDFLLDEFYNELQHIVRENSNLDNNFCKGELMAENFCFVIWCITSLFKLLEQHFTTRPMEVQSILPSNIRTKLFLKLNEALGFVPDNTVPSSAYANVTFFDRIFDLLLPKVYDDRSRQLVQIARHSLKVQAISTYSAGCLIANEHYFGGVTVAASSVKSILSASDRIFPTSSNSPANEQSCNVLDGKTSTKYLNADKKNSGFTVIPVAGVSTVVSISLTTANDHPERDPSSWLIEGSNSLSDTVGFEKVAEGLMPAVTTRHHTRSFNFINTKPYAKYRITFPTIVDQPRADAMQIGSVSLQGAVHESVAEASFCNYDSMLRSLFVNAPLHNSNEVKHLSLSSVPIAKPFSKSFYQLFASHSICNNLAEQYKKNVHSAENSPATDSFFKVMFRKFLIGKLNYSSDESESSGPAFTTSSLQSDDIDFPHTLDAWSDTQTICIFLRRLANPFLLEHTREKSNQPANLTIKDEFYAGELNLLKNFQSEAIRCLLNSKDDGNISKPKFSSENKQFFSYSDDGKSVTHVAPTAQWHTALSSKCIQPNTGIHEIRFYINKCEAGHVFLGLGTMETVEKAKAGETFLGDAKKSWGFIGNKCIWNDRKKYKSSYSTGFMQGHTITMIYDSDKRTLSFSNESDNWGLAVEGLPREIFFPAVTLYQPGDKITFITRESHLMSFVSKDIDYLMSFVTYSQNLLQLGHSLLAKAKSELPDRESNCVTILSNPLLTTLLPSLVSHLYSSIIEEKVVGILAVQLAPYLNEFIKLYVSLLNDMKLRDGSLSKISDGVVSKLSGLWAFDYVSSSGSRFVKKVYDCDASDSSSALDSFGSGIRDIYSINGSLNTVSKRLCKCGRELKLCHLKGFNCDCVTCPKKSTSTTDPNLHRYRCDNGHGGDRLACNYDWCGYCFSREEKVVIESAYYYDKNNCENANVTEIVNRERRSHQRMHFGITLNNAQDGSLSVRVTNQLFGDKLKGKHKSLWINCRNEKGEKTTITFPENSEIDWSKIDDFASRHIFSLKGSQFGNKVKFSEELNGGDVLVAEGSLSLCGLIFSGEYRIQSSGETGSIRGNCIKDVKSSFETKDSIETSQKIVYLCASLLGRFVRAFCSGLPMLDVCQESVPHVTVASSAQDGASRVLSDVRKWKNSPLFSGGLLRDRNLHKYSVIIMARFLRPHAITEVTEWDPSLFRSFAEMSDKNHRMKNVMREFMHAMLPDIVEEASSIDGDCSSSSNSSTSGGGGGGRGSAVNSSEDSMLEKGCEEIFSSNFHKHGTSRDIFMKQKDGQYPKFLECRQKTFAALVKHSGYLSVLMKDIEAFKSNNKYVPCSLVNDLYLIYMSISKRIREIKRVALPDEQDIDGTRGAAVYEIICAPIIEKASFLLEVCTCDKGFLVSGVIDEKLDNSTDPDIVKRYSNNLILKDIESFLLPEYIEKELKRTLAALAPKENESESSNATPKSAPANEVSDEALRRAVDSFFPRNLVDEVRNELQSTYLNVLQKFCGLKLLDSYFSDKKNSYSLNLLSAISDNVSSSLLKCNIAFPTPTTDTITLSSKSCINLPVDRSVKALLTGHLERFYDCNTILISRCLESSFFDGQISALCNWLVQLDPSQHVFLKSVKIFNKIQDLLKNIREVNSSFDSIANLRGVRVGGENSASGGGVDVEPQGEDLEAREGGPYIFELIRNSTHLLADIALRIVYGLTAQVAFSVPPATISSLSLKKQDSGPATLVKTSLFELLYTELSYCFKVIVSKSFNVCEEKSSSMQQQMGNEDYTLKILYLLKLVSKSDSCKQYLATSQWISILLSAFGCGSLNVQKSITSFITDLFFMIPNPSSIKLFVPSLFCDRSDFLSEVEGLNESKYEAMSDENVVASANSAERVILLLLECISSIIPSHKSESETVLFYLNQTGQDALEFLSAEALIVLRKFLGSSSWRSTFLSTAVKVFNVVEGRDADSYKLFRLQVALCGVFGGYFERLRLGGTVILKPHILFNQNFSKLEYRSEYAHYSTFSYLGEYSNQGENQHEIVKVNRHSKFEKTKMGNDYNSELYNYCTNVNSRTFTANREEFFATYDIPILFELLPDAIFQSILENFIQKGLPWIRSTLLSISFGNNSAIAKAVDPAFPVGGGLVSRSISRESSERPPRRLERSIDEHDEDHDEYHDEDNDGDEHEGSGADFHFEDLSDHIESLDQSRQNEAVADDVSLIRDWNGSAGSSSPKADDVTGSSVKETVTTSSSEPSSESSLSTLLNSVATSDDNVNANNICNAISTLSSLKSISLGVKNADLVSAFLNSYSKNPEFMKDLLKLSMLGTSCGGLDVLESTEEIWVEYCDAYKVLAKAKADADVAAAKEKEKKEMEMKDKEIKDSEETKPCVKEGGDSSATSGSEAPSKQSPSPSNNPYSSPPCNQAVVNGVFNVDKIRNLTPAEQLNYIGEYLYAKISLVDPQRAGKITGMWLELDILELIQLLESPEMYRARLDETIAFLGGLVGGDAKSASDLVDEILNCTDCQSDFVFTAGEKALSQKGLGEKPTRCKACAAKSGGSGPSISEGSEKFGAPKRSSPKKAPKDSVEDKQVQFMDRAIKNDIDCNNLCDNFELRSTLEAICGLEMSRPLIAIGIKVLLEERFERNYPGEDFANIFFNFWESSCQTGGNSGRSHTDIVSEMLDQEYSVEESNFLLIDRSDTFLLEFYKSLGFPQSLYLKGLEENGGDAFKTLEWLRKNKAVENVVDAVLEEVKDDVAENSAVVFNPLHLYGRDNKVSISNNLTCSLESEGSPRLKMPSVACRNYPVVSGKWYYECTLKMNSTMRLGWADMRYNPVYVESKGVGENSHSWGFDGCSKYLWHEIPSEWGSRWSVGDVIGCAVDLDNRVMSFFNKGLAEEVNMGDAFRDFEYSGGLFPAVSFNAKETSPNAIPAGPKALCTLNFGGRPFKYFQRFEELGYRGYKPYSDNFVELRIPSEYASNSPLIRSLYPANEEFIEDKLEIIDDLYDFREVNPSQRYFPVCLKCNGEAGRGRDDCSRCKPQMVSASISQAPHQLEKLIPQLLSITKDLCVLYSKLTILRITSALPILPDEYAKIFFDIFSQNALKAPIEANILKSKSVVSLSSIEALMILLRVSCSFTSRSQIYSNVMADLSSAQKVKMPENLGCIESIGGPLLLDHHSQSIKLIFRRNFESENFIDFCLDLILSEVVLSTRDDFKHKWVYNKGLCPFIIHESPNESCFSTPSLHFAVWLTSMLVNEFSYQLDRPDVDQAEISSKISRYVLKLGRSWILSLKGTSILVRTCAVKMISGLMHEVTGGSDCKFYSFSHGMKLDFVQLIPIDRIKDMLSNKLLDERENVSIFSEFLQQLLELYNVLQYFLNEVVVSPTLTYITTAAGGGGSNLSSSSSVNGTNLNSQNPYLEQDSDMLDPLFDWESVSGRIASDNNWITWTGFITQHKLGQLDGIKVDPKRVVDESKEVFPSFTVSHNQLFRDKAAQMRQSSSPPLAIGQTVLRSSAPETTGTAPASSSASASAGSSSRRGNGGVIDLNGAMIGTVTEITSWKSSPKCEMVGCSCQGFDSVPNDSQLCACDHGSAVHASGEIFGPGTAVKVRWSDGIIETVRWGPLGIYDVQKIEVDKDGKTGRVFPNPVSTIVELMQNKFGAALSYGVILRLRNSLWKDSVQGSGNNQIISLIEIPDFSATILAEGTFTPSLTDVGKGRLVLTERKFLSGPTHADWTVRFGTSSWQPGTIYELDVNGKEDRFDITIGGNVLMPLIPRNIMPGLPANVTGDIRLQQKHLFVFDDNWMSDSSSSNIGLSRDKLSTFFKSRGPSNSIRKSCVFGNVGFSSGVHYWEFRIECKDPLEYNGREVPSSVFIGIAEKPFKFAPVTPKAYNDKIMSSSKWWGKGYQNNKVTFTNEDGEKPYGTFFLEGQTVGVLLDLNIGRMYFCVIGGDPQWNPVSFFDLGEAFSQLNSTSKVSPKTYFPIVGIQKVQNKVCLLDRWVSSVGRNIEEELKVYQNYWSMIASWKKVRPSSSPLANNIWLYREAWREWKRWMSGRYLRVLTRVKNLPIVVDISPIACLEASIRLGLKQAYFHGDRIVSRYFLGKRLWQNHPIEDRILQTHYSEFVIIGAHKGMLWCQFSNHVSDSFKDVYRQPIWPISEFDIEGTTLMRRRPSEISGLPSDVTDLILPRIPHYHGRVVQVTSDCKVRDTLEITDENSRVIGTVNANESGADSKQTKKFYYAFETRMNASNIRRLKILWGEECGWISERSRGDNEESLVSFPTLEPKEIEELKGRTRASVCAIAAHYRDEYDYMFELKEVDSLSSAVSVWKESVAALGGGKYSGLLKDSALLSDSPYIYHDTTISEDLFSFDSFVSLASTMGDGRNWPEDADKELSKKISMCSSLHSIFPQNLPWTVLSHYFAAEIKEGDVLLHSILKANPDRLLARSALLRMANKVIGYALPAVNQQLVEKQWNCDIQGCEVEIDVKPSIELDSTYTFESAPPSPFSRSFLNCAKREVKKVYPVDSLFWSPPSGFKFLKSIKELIFTYTKKEFFTSVLESTTTPTPIVNLSGGAGGFGGSSATQWPVPTLEVYTKNRDIKDLFLIPQRGGERFNKSYFGQFYNEINSKKRGGDASFRQAYIMGRDYELSPFDANDKDLSGQKRFCAIEEFTIKADRMEKYQAFLTTGLSSSMAISSSDKIKGGQDTGAMYVGMFQKVFDELQSVGEGSRKECLHTLFVPEGDNKIRLGYNQSANSNDMEKMHFIGKILGVVLRHNIFPPVDIPQMHWRSLAQLPVSAEHYDASSSSSVLFEQKDTIMKKLLALKAKMDKSPPEWPEEYADYTYSDPIEIYSKNGPKIQVNLNNWKHYFALAESFLLKRSCNLHKKLSDGLKCIVPTELFPMFDSTELEESFTGPSDYTIEKLRDMTTYIGCTPESPVIQFFWEALESFSSDERVTFLDFVWNRRKIPPFCTDKLQIKMMNTDLKAVPNTFPVAHSCTFTLDLPNYQSLEVLKQQIKIAIENCKTIDRA